MNPFNFKEGGILFLKGLGYLGISTATLAGIGAVVEFASQGWIGCRPSFNFESPNPIVLDVGTRCGFRNLNVIGLDFTFRAGLDRRNSLYFQLPTVVPRFWGEK